MRKGGKEMLQVDLGKGAVFKIEKETQEIPEIVSYGGMTESEIKNSEEYQRVTSYTNYMRDFNDGIYGPKAGTIDEIRATTEAKTREFNDYIDNNPKCKKL